jgi:hypothetical protein
MSGCVFLWHKKDYGKMNRNRRGLHLTKNLRPCLEDSPHLGEGASILKEERTHLDTGKEKRYSLLLRTVF